MYVENAKQYINFSKQTIYHYLALKKLKCFENDVLVVTRDKVIIDHLTSITNVVLI